MDWVRGLQMRSSFYVLVRYRRPIYALYASFVLSSAWLKHVASSSGFLGMSFTLKSLGMATSADFSRL